MAEMIYTKTARKRRALLALSVFSTTSATGLFLWYILTNEGVLPTEWLFLVLFLITITWTGFGFWTGFYGFWAALKGYWPEGLNKAAADAPVRSRTVIAMPVYNEDIGDVLGRLRAMRRELQGLGLSQQVDFFLLSDTTDPDLWLTEEAAWTSFARDQGEGPAVFYRHRPKNTARKAGNIADFIRRWGGNYDYMIVLDADSVMAGSTMAQMIRLMDANDGAGLIQTVPRLMGGSTLFARLQQYAGVVQGPIFATGLSWWSLGDCNYWGHNAIIRVRAFAAAAGLPDMPGRAPFGGHIMSHDFVEAALLRRAGWTVWMLPDMGGSWEGSPPTVIDFIKRDRRWCQGNIQHARVLLSANLHPLSRLHMLMGVMSYVSAPLWLLLLLTGGVLMAQDALAPVAYFGPVHSLFPDWPIDLSFEAMLLFVVSMALVLAPKALGVIELAVVRRDEWKAMGGFFAVWFSALIELVFSTLLAPLLMLHQSSFVIDILAGRHSGWLPQQREADSIRWSAAFAVSLYAVVVGGVLGGTTVFIAPDVLPWSAPVLAAMIGAPVTTWLVCRGDLGRGFRRLGLLTIPEESQTPTVPPAPPQTFSFAPPPARTTEPGKLLADQNFISMHLAMLQATGAGDPVEAALVQRWLEGATLTPNERGRVLADLQSLQDVLRSRAN